MSGLNILVSGGGIAGSVVAYWLGKAGANVTVFERAPVLRQSGQGIDIRGRGLDIVKKMGLWEAINTKTTKEPGMDFVDDNNLHLAALEADGSSGFTAEIEIIRSDLAEIFYEAALSTNQVKYEFGTFVESLSQSSSEVTVTLQNGQVRSYDLVIGADGFSSRTRRLILGLEKSKASIKSLDGFVAYFDMPASDNDGDRARWFMTTGRRGTMLRPKGNNQMSAYVTYFSDGQEVRDIQSSGDIEVQKRYLNKIFAGVGWEVPRVLKCMHDADEDNFYFQEIGQIRLDPSSWHQGRCVLIGDTAYCPSPFTGMGTTLAIIGAYLVAGEIAAAAEKNPTCPDFEGAFKNYEATLGPYVKEVQRLPLGGAVVSFLNPASAWGLWFLRNVLWFVDRSGLLSLSSLINVPNADTFKLPEYSF